MRRSTIGFAAAVMLMAGGLKAQNPRDTTQFIGLFNPRSSPTIPSGYVNLTSAPINVRDFGAKGDSVTDDAPAFRAAFLAAQNSVNRLATVYAPSGRYRLGTGLQWNARVNLVGEGAGPNGTVLIFPSNTGVALTVNPSFVNNAGQIMYLQDFMLLGGGASTNDTGVVIGSDYIQVQRVSVGQNLGTNQGFGQGLVFLNASATFQTFVDVNFQMNGTAITWPNGGAAGENIRFIGGSAVNCQNTVGAGVGAAKGVELNGSMDIYFNNFSVDNCQFNMQGGATGTVACFDCHFEAVNATANPLIVQLSGHLYLMGALTIVDVASTMATAIQASDAVDPGHADLVIMGARGLANGTSVPWLTISGGLNVFAANLYVVTTFTTPISGSTTGTFNMWSTPLGTMDNSFALTSGTTPALDASKAGYYTLTITSNIAVTIAVPTNNPGTSGSKDIAIAIRNGSGGALTTAPTFNGGAGGFKFSAVTNPANGTQVVYRFRWDPVQSFWYEVGTHQASGL